MNLICEFCQFDVSNCENCGKLLERNDVIFHLNQHAKHFHFCDEKCMNKFLEVRLGIRKYTTIVRLNYEF